ncbi:MAG TPA: SPFH domain-containing protein [Candidatus Methylacidiphilales bacterium]|nr:SPFH domain-containing protein [Candidatus Methylacidiphilales bacterium]
MDLDILYLIGGAALLIFVAFVGFLTRYKRCPSDRVLVIYGRVGAGRSARCMHGGAAFVLPVVQDYQFLDLRPMSIDIQLNNALSKQNIRVSVPSTFTIGITTDPDKMGNAAERLLGFNNTQIMQLAKEIIFGQMRQVVATMRIEEINADRDQLILAITNNVSTELEKVGLRLINVNIQDVTDESGYIDALGKEASAKAIADAKIKVAQAERDSEIGKALAEKEMTVSVASAQAESTQGKNMAQQQIAQSNADLRIKQAEAARTAQIAENVAKADVERQTFEAESKAQAARAEMQRKQQYAERVVPAEIAKDALVVQSQAAAQQVTIAAEAEGKRNIVIKQAEAVAAEAEAKRILALKQAEGAGIKAVLEGRAEGFRQLVASAGGNASEAVVVLVADQLPGMIDSQMKGISNLKIDKVVVWGGGDGGKGGISHLLKDLIAGLPPVTELARAAGINLPPVLGQVSASVVPPSAAPVEAPPSASPPSQEKPKQGMP